MAPGGPRPALLLLLALLPAGLAHFLASRSAQELVWKHVDFPRTSPPPGQPYCDYLMWQQRSRIRGCRRSFTFVHAEPVQLYSLCRCHGRCQPTNRTSVSRHPVPITTCRMVPGLGRCSYVGRSERRRVRVACSSWKPVDVLGTVQSLHEESPDSGFPCAELVAHGPVAVGGGELPDGTGNPLLQGVAGRRWIQAHDMAPGGPRPALLLLLALLPPGLAWLSASRSTQDFVARHVDFPRSRPPPGQQYCDYLLQQGRSLPGPLRCPFTFFHADPSQLASLCRCGDGSQPRDRTCVSRNRIPTTTGHRGCGGTIGMGDLWGFGSPVGSLSMGRLQRRRIRVACRGREPVGVLGTV